MTIENNNNNEQIQIDLTIKQEQIDRNFEDVLKEFQNMSHKEQWEFIEALANKDPHFNELYTQLKVFFQDRVMNPENYDNHLKLQAVKKHIEGTDLDTSKNERITLEPNTEDLTTLKAKFYRTWPDNKEHSKYFTISHPENQKLATIEWEFDKWIIEARNYIDDRYSLGNEAEDPFDDNDEKNIDANDIVDNKDKTKQVDTSEKSKDIELSNDDFKNLVEKWNLELQKINETNEKINNKLLSLNLILDISWMYKEYLQSILTNIKFKFVSNKDERYENQIDVIEKKITKINNLTEYLSLLWNTDELLDLDVQDLLNKLIVSEEKIQDLWNFDQPVSFLWNKENKVDSVNIWYEDIKSSLLSPSIKSEEIQGLKMDIFTKIRSFDWLDDDKHRYNTNEWIRVRITDDILNNSSLRKDNFIKNNFDLINSLWEKSINEFLDAFKWGKENLGTFLEKIKLFDNLWITRKSDRVKLLENIYSSLKKWEKNIDENRLWEIIKNRTISKIKYLESKVEKAENKDEILSKINELNESLSSEKIKESVEKIKEQTIFKTFERIVIFETLEKKSELVKDISKSDKGVDLYRDIEWIWSFNMSDDEFNSYSTWTQFLAEQIAIMAISGWVWSVALRWFWKLAQIWETTHLLKWGFNAINIWKLTTNTVVEWSAFYLTYTWLNGLVNEKEAVNLFDKLNSYDAVRTIIFLWVLRAISKTNDAITVKDIWLDTASILWTDLIVRASLWQLMWKEKIEWVDFKNLSNFDLKEFWSFLADELKFIIPLVIWLKISDRSVNQIFKEIDKPRIEFIPQENSYLLRIEWLKKDIRILEQNRNSLRNKRRKTSEINARLREKKAEYKEAKKSKIEFVWEQTINKAILQKPEQTTTKSEEKKRSNSKEDINVDTWISPKYKNLEKYSKEAQLGKIDYVLKDNVVEKTLSKKWIWKKWKSVWEGLLKKAWFNKTEIKDYNEWKLRSEKAEKSYEKEALKEMERANEIIYKNYTEWVIKLSQWIDINKAFPDVSPKLLPKLANVIVRENTWKRERL